MLEPTNPVSNRITDMGLESMWAFASLKLPYRLPNWTNSYAKLAYVGIRMRSQSFKVERASVTCQ